MVPGIYLSNSQKKTGKTRLVEMRKDNESFFLAGSVGSS